MRGMIQETMALVYTAGFFGILVAMMVGGYSIESKELLGVLTAAQIAIIQYYFGSSKGSADKNGMLGPKSGGP